MPTKTKTNGSVNRIEEIVEQVAVTQPEIWSFTVKGVSPLLQNNPANFIGVEDSGALSNKKKYDDEEEARLRVYKDGDDKFVHPAQSFIRAMVKAVSGRKFGKLFATKAIERNVFLAEPYCVLLDGNGKPAKKYAIDRQPCVVGKARILRCRPRWDDWSMKVALDVDTAVLTKEHVIQALALAGRTIGIGDYRPEKGGGFGRFVVVE